MVTENFQTQKTLSVDALTEFHHDHFVEDQVSDFLKLVGPVTIATAVVADVGGGCGFFARALQLRSGWRVRVMDMDLNSVETCKKNGVAPNQADAT